MTTTSQDPIAQIKKAEDDSIKQIEKASKEFEDKLREKEQNLKEKTDEYEQSLREQGQNKLNTVKKEAGELFKTEISVAEREKTQILADAKGKHKEAVNATISAFNDYINS